MNSRILGYRYDNVSQSLISDKEESQVVQCIFDLYTFYKLRQDEIENLIEANKSLHQIIEDRISDIWNKLYETNKNISKKFDENNIIKMLDNDEKVAISILDQVKKEIERINEIANTSLLEKIDDAIMLIQNKAKIKEKYGNFENISKTYKQYLNEKFSIRAKEHEAVISKELWEEIAKRVNMPKENIVIDITE